LLVVTVIVGTSACRPPGIPKIDGVAGAPSDRATPWTVPAPARTPAPPAEPPAVPAITDAMRRDSATAGSARQLSLADVVDLALRNNPSTRESWENALAAADLYGSAKGARYPTINASINATQFSGNGGFGGVGGFGATPIDTTQGNARGGVGGASTGPQITPAVSFSYLIVDHGARAGRIEAAKQQAIAMNLAHNLTVENVVLQAESTLFSYLAARGLRDAEVISVKEAITDTAAAEARLRVGIGILEDVYQTRTALAQARLQLATYEGNLVTAKGNLAAALGFPANARFDIPDILSSDSVASITASVDTLINRAIVGRPDLAEARASAKALAAQVRVARSAGYPSLTLSSNGGLASRLLGQRNTNGTVNYTLQLGLQIPIFNGFSRQYDVRAAEAQYQAGLARERSTRQQITVQVFTSYEVLRTSVEKVAAAADLLRSARLSSDGAVGRYQEGVGTITDVLIARSALASARAQEIQARWEWQTALAQLAHDVGSLDIEGRPHLPLGPAQPAVRR
jgi:outer membrane protein